MSPPMCAALSILKPPACETKPKIRLMITNIPSCGTIARARRSSTGWWALVPEDHADEPEDRARCPDRRAFENRKLPVDPPMAVST